MDSFSNIKISHKLSGLMIGLALGFILIGVAYFFQIAVENDSHRLKSELSDYQVLVSKANVAQLKLRNAAFRYTQSESEDALREYRQTRSALDTLLEQISASGRRYSINPQLENIARLLQAYDREMQAYQEELQQFGAQGPTPALERETFRRNAYNAYLKALMAIGAKIDNAFAEIADSSQTYVQTQAEKIGSTSDLVKALFTALLFIVATAAALGMFFVYKGIAFPLLHIQTVIRKINGGNLKARVGLKSRDELGDLGRAFNKLLDERIQVLEDQSRENEQLNNSIISLIKSLGIIAQKDLTVKVPVSPDITGTVSDAVNLLTSETAKTLYEVKDISEQVNAVSRILHHQSEVVIKAADEERGHMIEASRALEHSAKTMSAIAREAETANDIARDTIDNTQRARETVTETVTGIQTIRDTISETEKRIKRLGERSQEITGIVNLINSIAERTHILALNASMHAASAGEAGRGFAVVAEEVQRLAENAREATSNISSMVNNIRVETSDTVTTMNRLITEVAEGTKMAEQAGRQMTETETSTRLLVDKVRHIAESSVNQAKFTNTVRNRATAIRRITELTGEKLAVQKRHTENLQRFSQRLVQGVNVFTLPDMAAKAVTREMPDSQAAISETSTRERLAKAELAVTLTDAAEAEELAAHSNLIEAV